MQKAAKRATAIQPRLAGNLGRKLRKLMCASCCRCIGTPLRSPKSAFASLHADRESFFYHLSSCSIVSPPSRTFTVDDIVQSPPANPLALSEQALSQGTETAVHYSSIVDGIQVDSRVCGVGFVRRIAAAIHALNATAAESRS